MNLVIDAIALIFAASAVVHVWRRGSIFAEWRAYFEARADIAYDEEDFVEASSAAAEAPPDTPRPLWMRLFDRLPDWFCELVNCAFCFSHHTPWLLLLLLLAPAGVLDYWGFTWLAFLWKVPLYSLATTRIGNLVDAWAPESVRYTTSHH
jgi:hypothetical protein